MSDPVKVEKALNAILDIAYVWIKESDNLLTISKRPDLPQAGRDAAWTAGKTKFAHAKEIIDAAHKELNG